MCFLLVVEPLADQVVRALAEALAAALCEIVGVAKSAAISAASASKTYSNVPPRLGHASVSCFVTADLDSWKHSRSRSLFVALRRRQRTGERHDTTDAHRSSGNRQSLAYSTQTSIWITINASVSISSVGKISAAISVAFSFVPALGEFCSTTSRTYSSVPPSLAAPRHRNNSINFDGTASKVFRRPNPFRQHPRIEVLSGNHIIGIILSTPDTIRPNFWRGCDGSCVSGPPEVAAGRPKRAPVHATFPIHIVGEDRMATAWPILETRIDVLRDSRKYLRVMRKSLVLDALFPAIRQQILAATLLEPEKSWYLTRQGLRP